MELRAALRGRAQLGRVGLDHAAVPVQTGSLVGGGARDADDGLDASGKQRGARESMWAAARDARDSEPCDPEMVGDGGDVRGDGGNVSAPQRG